MERERLITSSGYLETGHMGMVQSCDGRVRMNIRKNIFTEKVVKHRIP